MQELTLGEKMNALMRSAIVVVLSMGACTLLAQSLGEVAREIRDTPHPRAKKVVTNDEIPSVATMSATADSAKKGAADGTQGKTGDDKAAGKAGLSASELAKKDEERKQQEAELNKKVSLQQEKVSLLARELKVSEQEAQQKQLAHMADVNARLNGQQQYAEAEKVDQEDLVQKREKLSAEREKLDSMQEEARRAGIKLPD